MQGACAKLNVGLCGLSPSSVPFLLASSALLGLNVVIPTCAASQARIKMPAAPPGLEPCSLPTSGIHCWQAEWHHTPCMVVGLSAPPVQGHTQHCSVWAGQGWHAVEPQHFGSAKHGVVQTEVHPMAATPSLFHAPL